MVLLCLLLQDGTPTAVQEAASWRQNSAAFASRLLSTFPLYRDLLQPVALALHRVSYGLEQLAATAVDSIASPATQLFAELACFPRPLGM